MEVAPLSFCFIVLATLLALWFLKLSVSRRKTKHTKQQLPPGPWTLPIIGALHHVICTLPHRRLIELSRRYGPVMLLKLGEVPTVVVSSAEAAALVLKTNDPVFAERRSTTSQDMAGCGGRGIVFAPYGDHWRQMRKVCVVELLSSSQVRRMEGIRTEEVGNLLRYVADTASTGGTINISEKVMAVSNGVVSRAAFGGKFAEQEEYIRELDVMLTLLGGFSLLNLFPSSRLARWFSIDARRLQRSYDRMQHIIENVIEGKQQAARAACDVACCADKEDLVDVLLRLQKEDPSESPLTRESIFAVLIDIFAGATDTTGTVLEWAMSELVRHPDVMTKAYLEIRKVLGEDRSFITTRDIPELPYMRMVIKEVLRLHTPFPLIPRMTRNDCKILGYDMLKGTTVLINAFAVSRDPAYWKNAEDFIPERFENNNIQYVGAHFEFTPFGAGRR
ncbi:hypothetical protein QYE76_025623 [Lolium multiflorum]|uniref:Cytochrome P450 n=1 Tax=Lolium multiflorum TaxID=4521 RepID=A0AAD8VW65_LOLMU|nr:hypothetical protein QYE76_025623 [Lolium multiflorum]